MLGERTPRRMSASAAAGSPALAPHRELDVVPSHDFQARRPEIAFDRRQVVRTILVVSFR